MSNKKCALNARQENPLWVLAIEKHAYFFCLSVDGFARFPGHPSTTLTHNMKSSNHRATTQIKTDKNGQFWRWFQVTSLRTETVVGPDCDIFLGVNQNRTILVRKWSRPSFHSWCRRSSKWQPLKCHTKGEGLSQLSDILISDVQTKGRDTFCLLFTNHLGRNSLHKACKQKLTFSDVVQGF